MSSSPVKPLVQTMDFPNALRAVIDGKKISKLEWSDPNIFGVLTSGFLMLHKADGKYYQWIINDGDILGKDWFVVDEPQLTSNRAVSA